MSDEDKNTVSLREYIETKFAELEKRLDVTFKLQNEAVSTASSKLELRLESMNNFREQLSDQSKTFVTKTEHDFLLKRIDDIKDTSNEKIDEVKELVNARPTWITSVIIGVFTFVLGILGAIIVKGI